MSAQRCIHANVQRATRPVPDWRSRCPDCGESVGLYRQEVITIRERNEINAREGRTIRVVDLMVLLEQVRAPERPDAEPSEFDHGFEQAVADVRTAVIALTSKEGPSAG